MIVCQYAFAMLFLFAAVVQYNDPDPTRWMIVYGSAALVCILATRSIALARGFWLAPAFVAVVALLWAASIFLGIEHPLMPWRMFDEWEMKDVAVEETRETFGLLIVAGWMTMTAFFGSTGSHVSGRFR